MRVAISLAVLCLTAAAANAHSWYSERRDPIFSQTTCCGGQDCAPLPPHAISITPEGDLRITLTVEEARKINPVRRYGFDKVIRGDRIQLSEDGTPHICLMAHDFDVSVDGREGYYCVFLPPNG
jgi:hypothetical protein